MLRLVTIDLSQADLARFENYEAAVLSLLDGHNARLEMRLRSLDQQSETHLLYFADDQSFEEFLADPLRIALRPEWDACGATSVATEVEAVNYSD